MGEFLRKLPLDARKLKKKSVELELIILTRTPRIVYLFTF